MTDKPKGPHHGDPGRSMAGYAACGAYVHSKRQTTEDAHVKCKLCRAAAGLQPLKKKQRAKET
jgi:hypothetical protein